MPAIATATVAEAYTQPPNGVQFTLSGCRNNGDITFGVSGPFVCPDGSYTTGNLGKGWNELDLVPHRLTTNYSGLGTYNVIVAADYRTGTATGYDVISVPVFNAAKSTGTCNVVAGAQLTTGSVTGGATEVIYRELTITQSAPGTCVFDYYQRLSVGASKYSGSSLQSYMFEREDFSTGKRTISIPVKEILPQTIDKTMTATRGSDSTWNVVKSANPASVTFGDTCATGATLTRTVNVTVTWTKTTAPSGDVVVTTNLFATNPAARVITVNATDSVYEGSTASGTPLFTFSSGPVNVPANTADYLLMTDTRTVETSSTTLSDRMTATYIDQVTGVPVPGQADPVVTTATVQNTGSAGNATATITDTESITGTGLTFSVAAPSVGSFTNYTPGTATTGPVNWTSGTVSSSGSVTFAKTIYLDQRRITTGTLTDTASYTTSGNVTGSSNQLSIPISSTATVSLSITKTIPNVLTGTETATFNLDVTGPNGYRSTQVVTMSASDPLNTETGKREKTITLTGLEPGAYTVTEQPDTSGKWATQPPASTTITLPACSGSVTINNSFGPSVAKAVKVTNPSSASVSGWEFKLYRVVGGSSPDVLLETRTTNTAGEATFATVLEDAATYKIVETAQTGWDQTGVTGDVSSGVCQFSVNYPADADRTFSCTFTNTQRGSISIDKTVSGAPPTGTDAFTFQLRQGASTSSNGSVLDTQVANAGNGGDFTFSVSGSTLLVPGSYQVCEYIPPGWSSTIQTMSGAFVPGTGGDTQADNTYVCVPFTLNPGQTATITVDNSPPPGGMAKTIGFWKNHASCSKSNGHQDDVLGQNLGGIPIIIGKLSVSTCAVAVDILDKRAIANPSIVGDGKKMASDPAFNVAAQLLAYYLNRRADASANSTAAAAAAEAQQILDAVNFDGYTHDRLSAAQKTRLNQLSAILDSYNNNTLA